MPEVTTIRVILPIPVVTRITVGGVTHNVTAWGDITGTLSNQTDLQDALNLNEDLSNKSTDTSLGTSDTLYQPKMLPRRMLITLYQVVEYPVIEH